jgi:transposase
LKALCLDNYSAIVGIDWADKKHDLCELSLDDHAYHHSTISSRPEAIHDWARDLHKRFPDKPVAVACELKKGPLVYALMKHAHVVIIPLHPASVAKYRKAFHPSGAKSDPGDARLQTDMVFRHIDKFTALLPEEPEVRALAQLVEWRRKLVQDRVDLTNSITWHLKNYYPQVLDWFKEKDTQLFVDFLTRWPTLADVQRARKNTLRDFMVQHNVRRQHLIDARIKGIRSAVALTDDVGVIEPNQLMIESLIPQLEVLIKAIQRMDKEIALRYATMADAYIFDSLPGAGAQYAPRLLAALGTNRDRYLDANQIQKYSGIAPVIESSGNKSWTHWRYSCPKFIRQTFVEWAGQTVRYSFWARAYYEQQKAKGKPHNTIIRSLAFKWIRIIFRCWKERKPYDEARYLQTLKDRGSPILQFVVNG